MTPSEYCHKQKPKRGTSLYYSFLFTPKNVQEKIWPILAYCHEIAAVASQTTEPMIARTKLAWWRDETLRMFQGQAQHPITQALAAITEQIQWPQNCFEEFCMAIEMDQDIATFPTWKECELFCTRFAGAPAVLMAHVLGFSDPKTLEAVRKISIGLQLCSFIQNLGHDLRAGRVYLPQQEIENVGLNAHALRHLRSSPELVKLLAKVASRAREHLHQGSASIAAVDRERQLPHIIRSEIARALLGEMQRSDFDVLNGKMDLTVFRKFWVAVKSK